MCHRYRIVEAEALGEPTDEREDELDSQEAGATREAEEEPERPIPTADD